MNHLGVKVFAMRHGEPKTVGDDNSGLDKDKLIKVDAAAERIAFNMQGGNIIVATSHIPRAYETARRLVESEALTQLLDQEKPILEPLLAEDNYFSREEYGRSMATFFSLSRLTESLRPTAKPEIPRGLVLVTHDSVLGHMVRELGQQSSVNTDYAGVNQFQL